MAGIGTLTLLTPSSETQDFFCINFQESWYKPAEVNVVEELTAFGTFGTRMRIIRTDFKKFTMVGYADFASWSDAVANHNNIFTWIGGVASLQLTAAGTTFVAARKYYIWDIDAIVSPCVAVGDNLLTSDPKAMVRYSFTMQSTSQGT